MFISIFLALTMWSDRLQKQKECYKPLTMMGREKGGIGISMLHSIRNSIAYKGHTDYGYCGVDNGAKICHFLQGIKSTEFETMVNVILVKKSMH